jgi:hypothetical protein
MNARPKAMTKYDTKNALNVTLKGMAVPGIAKNAVAKAPGAMI